MHEAEDVDIFGCSCHYRILYILSINATVPVVFVVLLEIVILLILMVRRTINPEVRKVQGFDDNVTLGISIPKSYAKLLQIMKGSFLKIRLDDGQIIMEKV